MVLPSRLPQKLSLQHLRFVIPASPTMCKVFLDGYLTEMDNNCNGVTDHLPNDTAGDGNHVDMANS